MLNFRIKRQARQGKHAITCLSQIEASIIALANDDLLDLADIFKAEPERPLGQIAFAEMKVRGISLDN